MESDTKLFVYETYKTVASRTDHLARDQLSIGKRDKNQENSKSSFFFTKRVPIATLLKTCSPMITNELRRTVHTSASPCKKGFGKRLSQKARRRKLRNEKVAAASVMNRLEMMDYFVWKHLLEFIDEKELETCLLLNTKWMDAVRYCAPYLFAERYAREWRLPIHVELDHDFNKLSFTEARILNSRKKRGNTHALSTRCTVTETVNGTFQIINDSMLRAFNRGSVDSVCGTEEMAVLSCAKALHNRICYFEVSMEYCGSVGIVALESVNNNTYGFGSEEHLGWKGISYGYHGNDGDFVYNDGSAPYGGDWKPFGPSWGSTDDERCNTAGLAYTIGCGVDYDKLRVFFTLNGHFIGYPCINIMDKAYAAAFSFHVFKDKGLLNLGTQPFVFDIENFCAWNSRKSPITSNYH